MKLALGAPGIRSSFLLGFGGICAVLALTVALTLVGTRKMSSATDEILALEIPSTIQILSLARASDSLIAASGPLISVTTRADLNTAFERLNSAQRSLRASLQSLQLSNEEIKRLSTYSTQLGENLDSLKILTETRVELIEQITSIKRQLSDNQQNFQEQLTYRVRRLNADGDVIRLLLEEPNPPLQRVYRLVADTVPLLPVYRLYTDVLAIYARLPLAASQPTRSTLSLSQTALRARYDYAKQAMNSAPTPVPVAVTPILETLEELAFSDKGLFLLRARELDVIEELSQAFKASREIRAQIDVSTNALVSSSIQGIRLAAAEAGRMRSLYGFVIFAFAISGLVVVGIFFVVYVDRHLIRRLGHLSRAMRSISSGSLDVPLPREGSDELGNLGKAVKDFHRTANEARHREDNLRKKQEQLENARRALELKADQLEAANLELARLSKVDGLTGLTNRRHFDECIAREWSRALRDGQSLALMMVDIDLFKQYNDRYGHQYGDECLRKVGGVLGALQRRSGDVAARYGGEEFALLFPNTDLAAVQRMAEDARNTIASLSTSQDLSPDGKITASFGVACETPDNPEGYTDLISAADEALYRAKRLGRNRVAVAPSTPPRRAPVQHPHN